MSRLALAFAVAALAAGVACTSDGDPSPSPSASAASIVERPLPSAEADLAGELTLAADALERPGDGVRERHDRLQACIRLTRLAEHAKTKDLAADATVTALTNAAALCVRDQAAAAAAVRAAATAAP